jgi:hypothetical protein
MTAPRPWLGIGLIVTMGFLLAATDTTIRWLGPVLPVLLLLTTGHLVQALGMAVWLTVDRRTGFRTARPRFQALRGVLLLKEPVSRLRWALVAGGFAGALIVIRPGSGLFGWALPGWWLFGALPDFWGGVGMAVIAACGGAGAWLNVVRARRPPTPPVVDSVAERMEESGA